MAAPSNYAALAARAGIPFAEYAMGNGVGWTLALKFTGEDFTAATITVDLRPEPDLRVSATDMTMGDATLVGEDTLIDATLDDAGVSALGLAAEIGREIALWGRVLVTPDGGDPEIWAYFRATRLGS